MKIQIKAKGHTFFIMLPTRLLCCSAALKLAEKYGSVPLPDIPPDSAKALYQAIRQAKKAHKDWYLAEIERADGDMVKIKL